MRRFLSRSTKNATFSVAARGCSFINAAATTAIPVLSSRRFYCSSQPSDGAGGKQRGSDNKSNQTWEGTATSQPTSASKIPLSGDFFASPVSITVNITVSITGRDSNMRGVETSDTAPEDRLHISANPKEPRHIKSQVPAVQECFYDKMGEHMDAREPSKPERRAFKNLARDYCPEPGSTACMICEEYVEDVNEIYQIGKDGHPKFHFTPVDQKKLFVPAGVDWRTHNMHLSGNHKNATLVVNVAKMLGKGGTKLQDYFLWRAQFKAVHFIGTENLEEIGDFFLRKAQKLVCFTMSTPCPKLRSVGHDWVHGCTALEKFDISGCTALESVGDWWLAACSSIEGADFSALVSLKRVGSFWLYDCSSLRRVDFRGCSALEQVGHYWMQNCESLEVVDLGACVSLKRIAEASEERWPHGCSSLRRVVLPSDTKLPDDFVEKLERYLREKKAVVTRAEKVEAKKDDLPTSKKKRR